MTFNPHTAPTLLETEHRAEYADQIASRECRIGVLSWAFAAVFAVALVVPLLLHVGGWM